MKTEEFNLKIQNKFLSLCDVAKGDKEEANDQSIKIMMETSKEVRGKTPRNSGGKLSKVTKYLMKCKHTKIRTCKDVIELEELTKVTNSNKVRDIYKFNMDKIEESLMIGRSMKATKR